MGKVTGFMEYERVEEGYAPVPQRLKHYKEFVIGLTNEQAKVQGARCMDCGTPFCNSGCPVNNIIPDWNDLVYRGHWRDALDVLHSTNNFPEFTGRVCPAPCEAACTLNINDDPVGIKSIEHAIIDRAWAEGWVVPRPPAIKTGKTVAVAGGFGTTQPSAQARSMIACSIDLMPTGSSLMLSVHAASHGAGQMRPVNSGKLFVESRTANAFFQSARYTRSLKSGMMLLTGQPLLQNGVPQSMQRALCTLASSSLSVKTNSR